MTKNNACLPNIQELIQAGFNPKTGLPIKLADCDNSWLETAMNINMRIIDEQDAINRYNWVNLPKGLNGQMIERILYYRGQGIMFTLETDGENKFYFLPYALSGSIDVYGRFKSVVPLTFGGGVTDAEGKAKNDKTFLPNKVFEVVYDIIDQEDYKKALDLMENGCVILRDYTEQLSQTSKPRQILNDPLCKAIAECFPFARTSLIAHSGVRGMRVVNEDDQAQAFLASKSIEGAAKTGQTLIPFVAKVEVQDLAEAGQAKTEEYLIYMQALENIRLGTLGLDNGGIFQKKERKLVAEQAMNASTVGFVYNDGLKQRQRFCDIVNSIWGLGIWCEASENQTETDLDFDGDLDDDEQSIEGGGYYEEDYDSEE